MSPINRLNDKKTHTVPCNLIKIYTKLSTSAHIKFHSILYAYCNTRTYTKSNTSLYTRLDT